MEEDKSMYLANWKQHQVGYIPFLQVKLVYMSILLLVNTSKQGDAFWNDFLDFPVGF